jgi:decaprenyl-phosphate phosphoribosyltransferase
MKYLQLIRLNNWIKNLFIFIPLFFSSELLNSDKFILTLFGSLGFSLVTSLVYVINDIFDIDFDKSHPDKKDRPIPSGIISIRKSLLIGLILFILGLITLWFTSFHSFLITIFYFILNVSYSYKLKHVPIIDFVVISIGFVIRILIGGVIGEIELSQWIIVMVFLLSLFIAVTKRRDDVYQFEVEDKVNRKVVDKYTVEFMDKIITIVSSVLIVSYLLFITSEDVVLRYSTNSLLITFIFVLIGIFRYNQITYVYNKSGSPIKTLFKDRFLQIILFCWTLTFFVIIYLNQFINE